MPKLYSFKCFRSKSDSTGVSTGHELEMWFAYTISREFSWYCFCMNYFKESLYKVNEQNVYLLNPNIPFSQEEKHCWNEGFPLIQQPIKQYILPSSEFQSFIRNKQPTNDT